MWVAGWQAKGQSKATKICLCLSSPLSSVLATRHGSCACRLWAAAAQCFMSPNRVKKQRPQPREFHARSRPVVLEPALLINNLFLPKLLGATHLPVISAGTRKAQQKQLLCLQPACLDTAVKGIDSPYMALFHNLSFQVSWVHDFNVFSHKTCLFIFLVLKQLQAL